MALISFPAFFALSLLVLLVEVSVSCPESFDCGGLQQLSFPFSPSSQSHCGLYMVECERSPPRVQLGTDFYVINGIISSLTTSMLEIYDEKLQSQLDERSCSHFRNITFPDSPLGSFTILHNLTLFKCNKTIQHTPLAEDPNFNRSLNLHHMDCDGHDFYYRYPDDPNGTPGNLPPNCAFIQLPAVSPYDQHKRPNASDPFSLLTANFSLIYEVSVDCRLCHLERGRCTTNGSNEFHCAKEESHQKLILATAIPGSAFILTTCLVIYIIGYRNKWKYFPTYYLSRNISSDPSSKSDLEGGRVFFGVPVFSYSELEEATHNFDESKELGDGGFGTVYHGKLQDGREVAVKRLYEHNYKRVEQFMNEIKILTCLRHKNLVSLYGCTSRHSRELLLVYEYIPNGTVADHLQGDRAKSGLLTWPIRMKIAIETADALAYLHASDIIHRDVKTNNILLDNNFCVKVADFGLSRLFPVDVTHVSTAPQGTPGYVDPEYHQCYQLTDKSDVYSFGVVLTELISSMPAVDISRHRHEINLANLAINRIQRCAFDELIDPWLGYQSDTIIERMTTSVAELAFRCLQHEKEMRPTMDEVLEALKEIRGEDLNFEKTEETKNVGTTECVRPHPSPASEDDVLLKNKFPSSPISVNDKWASSRSTSASR